MKSSKKEEILIDKRKRRIPVCSWLPAKSESQLVIVHGFSEHMWYYQTVAKQLSETGMAVHMMDLPGHGMAEGIRGHIDRFGEYLDNLEMLTSENPHYLKTKPTFLLGHSLGGLIAAHYCLRRKHSFKGLILTSPLAGLHKPGSLPVYLLARLMAKNHRNEPYPKPIGVRALSRNPEQWPIYYSDPCRGRLITPNLFLLMNTMSKRLQDYAPHLHIPLLMFITDKDRVVSPDAGRKFFRKVGSEDKSLVVFSDAMHELFQEEECAQILDIMQGWIGERI